MPELNIIRRLQTGLKFVIKYLNEYRLIYIGIILCTICCFNFNIIFNADDVNNPIFIILLLIFFAISFMSPIVLGLIFVAKSFIAKTRRQLLSNIIHSYLGSILVFAALYYQCSVIGDFNDAVNKRDAYESQIRIKNNMNPELVIMRVVDQRAFRGIKARLWSGYDYPDHGLLYGKELNPDSWHTFTTNVYEELSINQIERIVNNNELESSQVIEYQKHNVMDVYIDCLYFSVICIATVGFGDISPNLWYSKLFTSLEVLIGISIFVFAIGMLFNRWSLKKLNNHTDDNKSN